MRTVAALLEDGAAANPDGTYLLYGDDAFSFAAFRRSAVSTAAAVTELGVGRGSRVVAILPNAPSFLVVFFGLARAGAILVPVNPQSTAAEIAAALVAASPSLVVTDPERVAVVREAAEETGSVAPIVIADELSSDRDDSDVAVPVSPEDVAVMFLTSGTTGEPKLVMQTHRALVLAAEGFPWWLGLESADRLLTALPLFHVNALAYSALGSLAAGASFVLLPRFSARSFWSETRAFGATQFNVVGAMLEILARRPAGPDDANPARLCYTALAPATRAAHLELERRFDLRLVAGYGLSECPYGTIWPLGEPPPYGSMGRLKQHPTLGDISAARVVGESGRDVPQGGEGELLLRNPAVMTGYFGRADETRAALEGGWLHTGDVVRLGLDGNYYFVARKKEVIRRRGENIAPGEIETALLAHEAVAEAAVIAVPSDLGEDDVKAFVVAAEGSALDVEELRRTIVGRLAAFKVPRYVEIVGDLPRTPTGRVARHLLPRGRTDREIDFG